MPLIEHEDIGEALRFGWKVLPELIRDRWCLLAITIACVTFVDWHISQIPVIAIYVAGAVVPATLYAVSRRGGSHASFMPIIILAATYTLITLCAQLSFFVHVGPLVGSHRYLLALALVILINWLELRLGAALPILLMRPQGTVLPALHESWNRIHGATWWRFWALRVATDFAWIALAYLSSAERYWLIQSSLLLTFVLTGHIIAVVGRAWYGLAATALVSSIIESPDALEASLAQTQ